MISTQRNCGRRVVSVPLSMYCRSSVLLCQPSLRNILPGIWAWLVVSHQILYRHAAGGRGEVAHVMGDSPCKRSESRFRPATPLRFTLKDGRAIHLYAYPRSWGSGSGLILGRNRSKSRESSTSTGTGTRAEAARTNNALFVANLPATNHFRICDGL